MVAIDRSSSVPPHIQPPMAHVPRATRETSISVPGMRIFCMRDLLRLPWRECTNSGSPDIASRVLPHIDWRYRAVDQNTVVPPVQKVEPDGSDRTSIIDRPAGFHCESH